MAIREATAVSRGVWVGFPPHSRREFHPGDEGGFGGFPPIRGADFHAGKIAGGDQPRRSL